MSGNSYGVRFMEDWSLYLGQCENISHININDIFVSRLSDEIPMSLINLTLCFDASKIKFMDLSNNAISANGCQALSHFIS